MIPPPLYFVAVYDSLGEVVGEAPLPVKDISFTDVVYAPGNESLGEFSFSLLDTHSAQAAYLRPYYNSLDREQRVEIYDNPLLAGDPVYVGVITGVNYSLSGGSVKGEDITRRLRKRNLRRNEILSGDPNDLLDWLCQTYNYTFGDDFDAEAGGVPDPAVWNAFATVVNAAGEAENVVGPAGTADFLETLDSWSYETWKDSQLSFDMAFPTDSVVSFYWMYGGVTNQGYQLDLSSYDWGNLSLPNEVSIVLYYWDDGPPVSCQDHHYTLVPDKLYHWDIFTRVQPDGSHTLLVDVNGVELIRFNDTRSSVPKGSSWIYINWGGPDAVAGTLRMDNFLFLSRSRVLQPSMVEDSSLNLEQSFQGNNQMEAVQWICDYLDWVYRVRYRHGAGNDLLDYGASIAGSDRTNLLLREGENIEELEKALSSEEFATSLRVYGNTDSESQSNFICNDLSQISTYGIVEGDYQDPKVTDSETGKALGMNRLAAIAANPASLTGKVLDESTLYRTRPIWGVLNWGGFLWGGWDWLRAGDLVTLQAASLDEQFGREARIVSIGRTSGSPSMSLTLDALSYSKARALRSQRKSQEATRRAYITRYNSFNFSLSFTDVEGWNCGVTLRGVVRGVWIDAIWTFGGGAAQEIHIDIDGVDRTTALGGPWTDTFHVYDETYLLNGEHIITFRSEGSDLAYIDFSIQAKVLS